MNKKAGKLSDALSWAFPWKVALMDREPTANDVFKNILGVTAVTVPAIAIASILANRRKMKEMREAIDKNAISNLNAQVPVLTPDSSLGNYDKEDKRKSSEINLINDKIRKTASISDFFSTTIKRAAPLATLPVATWLTAIAVNKYLKDKYAKELDAENNALQDMQNKLDIAELQRLGYITQSTEKSPDKDKKPVSKKASALSFFTETGGDLLRGSVDALSTVGSAVKKGGIDLPAALAVLGAAGLSAWGIHHFLKEHDDTKKLKLLKKRVLGRDRLMDSPSLLVELPQDYGETGKTTAQLIPGISPALLPKEVIEDAVVVEKPKKDVFLG